MMTPISSPQNIASLAILKLRGGDITWSQWLAPHHIIRTVLDDTKHYNMI